MSDKRPIAAFLDLRLHDDGTLSSTAPLKREGGHVAGAEAVVDTLGGLEQRISATRLLLTGPLALAWRKRTDRREHWLIITGDGWSIERQVPKRWLDDARRFAKRINTAGGIRN